MSAQTYTCPRCGIVKTRQAVRPPGLCNDCRLVVTDLRERGVWR